MALRRLLEQLSQHVMTLEVDLKRLKVTQWCSVHVELPAQLHPAAANRKPGGLSQSESSIHSRSRYRGATGKMGPAWVSLDKEGHSTLSGTYALSHLPTTRLPDLRGRFGEGGRLLVVPAWQAIDPVSQGLKQPLLC